MADSIKVIGESLSLPIFVKALMSLVKQIPLYPGPQCKKLGRYPSISSYSTGSHLNISTYFSYKLAISFT